MRNLCLIISTVLLSLLCVNAVQAKTFYESAVEKYNARQFQQAATLFSEALKQEPANQLYHYLLANCLVHTNEHKRASEEYKLAYVLDPASETGKLSKTALAGYKLSVNSSTSNNSSTRIDSTGSGNNLSKEMNSTKAQIRKQIEFEKDKHDAPSFKREQTMQLDVEAELRKIDQWAQIEIQKLNEPIVYTPAPQANPLMRTPWVIKEKEDQIRATAKEEKEKVLVDARARSQMWQAQRDSRSSLLNQTGDDLQSQLDQPMGKSGVKLQAHGTGLYVRYYGLGGPNKLPEPHQATARIREAGSGSNASDSDQKSSTQEIDDVKGKIVRDSSFRSAATKNSM